MKNLLAILLISLFVFSCSDDNSTSPEPLKKFVLSNEIEVGSQPAEIYYDKSSGIYHIFCLGKDVNYNGVKDAEDENPSWWIVYKTNLDLAIKRIEFDFGNMGFPFRPFIDFDNDRLYISQNNSLKIYDLNTSELITQIDLSYNANSISVDGNILYLSITKSFDSPGAVESYDLNTFEKISSTTCGFYVSQNLIFSKDNNKYLAVISQGNGSNNSILDIFKINNGNFAKIKSFDSLGNFANHIFLNDDELFVTMNGSHKIYVIDLDAFTIKNTINTTTDGYNGPREVAILNDQYLFTTTYNKEVIVFNKNTGMKLDSYSVNGKTEGLAFGDDSKQLLVAEINDENYSPINKVAVFILEKD